MPIHSIIAGLAVFATLLVSVPARAGETKLKPGKQAVVETRRRSDDPSLSAPTQNVNPKSAVDRVAKIQVELDRNHDSINVLYDMLATTAPGEHAHRSFLENQIHEFDARNEVLYDQMDQAESSQANRDRKLGLELVALDLQQDACKKETQAKLILESLRMGPPTGVQQPKRQVGTRVIEAVRTADTDKIDLFVENLGLRAEVASLQEQVAKLQAMVRKLKSQ